MGTVEGTLACVQPLVIQQVFLTHEALATVATLVGSLTRVDHLVTDQCRVAIEVDATLGAGEGALLGMAPLVEQKTNL